MRFRSERTRTLVTLAMLSATAYLVMLLSHLIPPILGFLRYDPSDVVTVIGGLLFGPLAAAAISVVVSLVEFVTISTTGVIGLVMNILSTCAFACTAAFIYKRRKTLVGAAVGLAGGVLIMTVTMLLWNYLITPLYMDGVSRADVAAMLPTIFLPFNLVKGGLNAAITILLYKPLVTALRKAHLAPESHAVKAGNAAGATTAKRASKGQIIGISLFAALILITCVMVMLVWLGVLDRTPKDEAPQSGGSSASVHNIMPASPPYSRAPAGLSLSLTI